MGQRAWVFASGDRGGLARNLTGAKAREMEGLEDPRTFGWPNRGPEPPGPMVLITGGAGFLGSHLSDELVAYGYHVRVLDNLCPQAHGPDADQPTYLNPDVEFMSGDVRDAVTVRRALRNVEAVFHFAAAAGADPSLCPIESYAATNTLGTAVLLDALIGHPVERLIVASSVSLYGEGIYRGRDARLRPVPERTMAQLEAGEWNVRDGRGMALEPVPTPETAQPAFSSVYALSKYDQEQMCLMTGRACDLPTVALRFSNVYGPRQALSNPGSGALARFAVRCLNDQPPLLFEDGQQRRDFVSVHDAVHACRLALECGGAAGQVFNIGSGQPCTVLEVADRLALALGMEDLQPQVTGRYRQGDVRHSLVDIRKARTVLGYEPRVTLDDGIADYAEWLAEHFSCGGGESARIALRADGLAV